MKGKLCIAIGVLVFGIVAAAHAQMGMDLFKRPSIAKAFHPVVGKGAQYATSGKSEGSKTHTMEMGIVGKESVDGKDGYWMEFVSSDDKGQTVVGKSLLTVDDFQFHKMIIQPPGQGAMEMPANMMARNRQKMDESLSEWHSVGSETVTVPGGTFSCEHWKNEKNGSEAWTSDKVVPFGMVKESGKDSSMVLLKVIDDFPERITGPVKQFDMQQMMQQQMQQRQQAKP
jgi:hypothetical protein